ncbi:hypothetical protein EYF80_031129 [Liparis tanakae]|uniref:Uncharacterized protein n=1 Tax=Liparis tanakae TaxID=230148 RepID=A0A4Z2GYM0_9TELE|nr:hypothetical protein EYF80_031129 [Liparis tanakae]
MTADKRSIKETHNNAGDAHNDHKRTQQDLVVSSTGDLTAPTYGETIVNVSLGDRSTTHCVNKRKPCLRGYEAHHKPDGSPQMGQGLGPPQIRTIPLSDHEANQKTSGSQQKVVEGWVHDGRLIL